MKVNILQIVDTYSWAIGTLSKAIMKYNPQYHWDSLELHPKDLERGKYDLNKIKEKILNTDIVDIQYWRTASQLFDLIPELKEKKVILTHHNEKNLLSADWKYVTAHVVKTKYSQKIIEEAYPNAITSYIPNSYDPNVYKYFNDYDNKKQIVGYVGRITPWKGLKEIVRACHELGYKLMIMGKHDKPDYWQEIVNELGEQVIFDTIDWSYLNCDDSEKSDFYKEISVYVGNSGPEHEVGTLGLIEAMAMGIPVVSSPAGIVADMGIHRENMMVFPYGNYEEMKAFIKEVIETPELREKLRDNGWKTIKAYNDERMAYSYSNLFNEILFDDDLVSVIIPATFNRQTQVEEILKSLESQTYRNIEALVCWDEEEVTEPTIRTLYESTDQFNIQVRHLSTNAKGYNLAMARNLAIIEAKGEYLMFCDSRMCPEKDAVEKMVSAMWRGTSKTWVFGEKGGNKTTFVENFSMVKRKEFVLGGMFNERVNEYGGMSQEIRERYASQGFEYVYLPEAKARQLIKSSMSDKRDSILRMKNLLYKLDL